MQIPTAFLGRRWPLFEPASRFLSRLAIVLVTLLLSALLARAPSIQVAGLLVLAGTVVALLRWPMLGIIGLVAGSLVVPLDISTGTETSLNFSILVVSALTGLWLLAMALDRQVRLVRSGPIKPMLVFIAVSFVAFVAGTQPWLSFAETSSLAAQAAGLVVFVLSACAFLLAAHQVRAIHSLEVIVWIFLAVGTVHLVERLCAGYGVILPRFVISRADGSVFWLWLPALAFGQALFNRRLPAVVRLFLIGLTLATFYYAIFRNQEWASGWIPGLVAVTVLAIVGYPRLALAGFIPAIALLASRWDKLVAVEMSQESYSAMTRLEAWRILAEIVAINPVLGLGFSNYYHYTPLFPILGYAVSFNSHNNYIDIIAQTGLIGFAAFAWVVIAIGRLAWRLRLIAPEGFARAYVYSAIGGLAGMLVASMLGDWVLPFVYNISLHGFRASVLGWLLLGGLVSIEQILLARGMNREDRRDDRSGFAVKAP